MRDGYPLGTGGAAVLGAPLDADLQDIVARGASPLERDHGAGPPFWAMDLHLLIAEPVHARPCAAFRASEIVSADVLAQTGIDGESRWSFDGTFAPLAAAAAQWLQIALESASYPVAPPARRRLLAQLVRRWWMAGAQLLSYRLQPSDLLTEHPGGLGDSIQHVFFGGAEPARAHWVSLWRAYPVGARLFAVVFHNWRAATMELVDRVGRDAPLLDEVFVSRGSLGALVDVRGDAGDLHDHGRSVAILTFANGARVVYKPKDLRVAAAYMRLAQDLNTAGLSPPLHVRKILARGAYAWEEYVVPEPCRVESDVHDFYRRVGMHTRLLQLTDGTDFTMDNVVAHAAHPVLVDLEMLLSPRMAHAADRTAADCDIDRHGWDLPTRCGMITAKIAGEPGRRAAEVGALAPASPYQAPFKQTMARRDETGTLRVVEDYAMLPGNRATPSLEGGTVRASDYLADVEDGYRSMAACLKANAAWLVRHGGPIQAMADAPVRYLCRDTHVYSRILQESVSPRALRDSDARERCLARLGKARFDTPHIVRSEIDSLRDFDVPMFTSMPNDDAIITGDGVAIPGVFDGAVHQRVLERLGRLASRSDPEEADAIRTALFVRDPAAPATGALRRPAPIRAGGWLDAAVTIGDEIAAAALRAGDGTVGWIGLTYDPRVDTWALGRLQPDLATGTAGLAVVLADLSRCTGVMRFADVARRIARALQTRLADVSSSLASRPPTAAARIEALSCGGPFGWGGWSYACGRVARTMEDPALGDNTAGRLTHAVLNELAARSPAGFAAGRAGLLMTLVWGGISTGSAAASEAGHLAAGLLHAFDPRRTAECASPDWPMTELPDHEAGIAAALLSHGRAAGCLTGASGDADGVAARLWRAGETVTTAGVILGRLLVGHLSPRFAARSQVDAEVAIRALQCANTSRHVLAAAEIAITTYQFSRRARYYGIACELANRLIARRRLRGTWFPASLAADRFNLSAVCGVSAIAHLMLKLHAPDHIASLRLMQ